MILKKGESLKKHRDIKLKSKKVRRNYLVLEPNYHTVFFSEALLVIKWKINKDTYE